MHIIIAGNPVGGYKYIGVFASISEANAWGTDHLTGHWWVSSLEDKVPYKAL